MTWILAFVLLAALVIPRLLRRRSGIVTVSRSQPISTLHTTMMRKTKKETKAALDAATLLLK